MTTAARPTFEPARGGQAKGEGGLSDLSALSKHYSSRDLPGQLKLKTRERGQGTVEELRSRDFRRHLEERERAAARERTKDSGKVAVESSASKRPRIEPSQTTGNEDADDLDDDEDEDESGDSDDDTAELLRELQKIKNERAEEEARKEREKKEEDEQIRTENIMRGNPLLNPQTSGSFKVKQRWDDDVVFKNCAKGLDDKPVQKHFINDMLRSEFHKKFMEKYIK
ncbi:spliceosome-associated protein CWC15 homolog [Corticium candelabrum]|uniref:spliceosome-associated protein CWC15 homolog n=1 Tax=Corticium candelabrum TaxID=121492 RepID=UPI002E275949|nr:spliceosome-associated protein CWC15 homolog [Corticium candelabrum]